jgi:CRP-like cAMP-binding protein
MRFFGRHAAPLDRSTLSISGTAIAVPSLLVHTEIPVRNLLLGSLPADEFPRVRPYMDAVRLEQGEQLFEAGTPVRHIYFPESAVISLVSTLTNGAAVEVATVGREGMVGLPVFLADDVSFVQTFTQIPGVLWRMDAEIFTRLASPPGALHGMLLGYTRAFLAQIAQTAACNATHLIEERCARWLLMTHDRVEADAFPLTHEFLAFMLGVRRAAVTLAMRDLQEAGMVEYDRGRVALVDRMKLEAAACDCYRFVRANFERLSPRLGAPLA